MPASPVFRKGLGRKTRKTEQRGQPCRIRGARIHWRIEDCARSSRPDRVRAPAPRLAGADVPRRFQDRWRPDCIRQFWAAALERYNDGLACAGAGRRAGAIYLWGYSAEMILKAAYFTLTGVADSTPLTIAGHITPAINHGRNTRGIPWPPQGQAHNVRAWAELLIAERAARGAAYAPDIALAVQQCGQRIGSLWRTSLTSTR
jgi:hypothetical protein